MCDPVTIMAVVTAATTAAQGYAAKQQGKYEQGVSRYNARLSENEAIRTRNKGTEEENKLRRSVAEQRSRQRAQLAANNLDLNVGSALQIQQDTETLGEVDALTIRQNYQDQARSLDDRASLELSRGDAARKAGDNAFTMSLLKGGASFAMAPGVSDKWMSADSAAMAGNGQQFASFA